MTAIFADFSIQWPPEILAILKLLNIFQIDLNSLQVGCALPSDPSHFEYWIIMVLLPWFVVVLLLMAAVVLQILSSILQITRFPLWFKRTFWRFLKPPIELSIGDDDSLTEKIWIGVKKGAQTIKYKGLGAFTKPLPKALVRMMYAEMLVGELISLLDE